MQWIEREKKEEAHPYNILTMLDSDTSVFYFTTHEKETVEESLKESGVENSYCNSYELFLTF